MTYRELWEKRIHEMPLEEFSRFMNNSVMQREFGDEQCDYCRTLNGGECPHHEDDNCMDDLVYLAAEVMEADDGH